MTTFVSSIHVILQNGLQWVNHTPIRPKVYDLNKENGRRRRVLLLINRNTTFTSKYSRLIIFNLGPVLG